jgi:hypothetical protein
MHCTLTQIYRGKIHISDILFESDQNFFFTTVIKILGLMNDFILVLLVTLEKPGGMCKSDVFD